VALGPEAEKTLQSLHVNRAIMGVAGITEDALYNANVLMVQAEQQMMHSADEVIVVADHGKFGKAALARLGGWDLVHRVITDDGVDAQWQQVVTGAGVELILAGSGGRVTNTRPSPGGVA
jgi:DeoR/GlpR family transcriptional regulator of sugar metabolism